MVRVIRNRAGKGGSRALWGREARRYSEKKGIQAMLHTRRGSIPRENAFETSNIWRQAEVGKFQGNTDGLPSFIETSS